VLKIAWGEDRPIQMLETNDRSAVPAEKERIRLDGDRRQGEWSPGAQEWVEETESF